MANISGTSSDDIKSGTAGSDRFTTGGSGTDQFTDTLGGNDTYLAERGPEALYYSGQLVITDTGSSGDVLDLTDFVLASGTSGLSFDRGGANLADLIIKSGSNEVRLIGQLSADANAGIETITYGGSAIDIGSLGSTEEIRLAVADGLVAKTDRSVIAVKQFPTIQLDEDAPATPIDLARFAADQDGQVVTYEVTAKSYLGETGAINGSSLTFTALKDKNGSDPILLKATGSDGKSVSFSVPITLNAINDAPTQIDQGKAITPGEQFRFDLLGKVVDVDDAPGDIVLNSLSPSSPTALGSYQVSGSELIYTANPGATGKEVLTIEFRDGSGDFNTSKLNITIQQDPKPPVIAAPGPVLAFDEDTTPAALKLTDLVSDPNGDPLTFLLVGNATKGEAVLTSDGSFTYVPSANANGNEEIAFRVSDGTATVDGKVLVQIKPVNDAPVPVADVATLTTGAGNVTIPVLANDSDPENDKLTLLADGLPANVSVSGGKSLVYTRDASRPTTDSFEYQVSDGKGGTAKGSVTVTVQGGGSGTGPTARDDSFFGTSKSLAKGLKVDPLSNDTSTLGKKGILKTSLTIEDGPEHGNVIVSKGKLVYRADDSFDGEDSFTYTVSDTRGGTSNLATVVISGPDLT